MFGGIATLLGFVVDIYSLYQIFSSKKEKGAGATKKGSNALGYILLLVGTLALIVGIIDIFSPGVINNGSLFSQFVTSVSDSSDEAGQITDSSDGNATTEQSKNKKVWIDDMQVFAYDNGGSYGNSYELKGAVKINTGDQLRHSVVFDCFTSNRLYEDIYTQHLDYYLNGNYSKFNATLAWTDEYKEKSGSCSMEILLDDESVLEYDMKKGFIPVEIDLDVSSAKIMKIQITNYVNYDNNDDAQFVMGNASFTQK